MSSSLLAKVKALQILPDLTIPFSRHLEIYDNGKIVKQLDSEEVICISGSKYYYSENARETGGNVHRLVYAYDGTSLIDGMLSVSGDRNKLGFQPLYMNPLCFPFSFLFNNRLAGDSNNPFHFVDAGTFMKILTASKAVMEQDEDTHGFVLTYKAADKYGTGVLYNVLFTPDWVPFRWTLNSDAGYRAEAKVTAFLNIPGSLGKLPGAVEISDFDARGALEIKTILKCSDKINDLYSKIPPKLFTLSPQRQ